jgi:hypothetical protein
MPTGRITLVSPSDRHAEDRLTEPITRATRPPTMRTRERFERSMATSRSAARGGTRVARTAGSSEASTVMPTPMPSDSTTVSGATTSEALGSDAPEASSPAVTPMVRRSPPRRPSTEATAPTTVASSRTDASTWARLAPRARSRASSLVRCATRIENVLEITKMPTSRAMPPKIVSAMVRKERFVWLPLESWAAASSPVMAWPPRASGVRSAASASGVTPESAFT